MRSKLALSLSIVMPRAVPDLPRRRSRPRWHLPLATRHSSPRRRHPSPLRRIQQIKADLLAAEMTAYANVKPLVEKYCASCHTKGQKGAKAKTLEHFETTTYPFGGHHAMKSARTSARCSASMVESPRCRRTSRAPFQRRARVDRGVGRCVRCVTRGRCARREIRPRRPWRRPQALTSPLRAARTRCVPPATARRWCAPDGGCGGRMSPRAGACGCGCATAVIDRSRRRPCGRRDERRDAAATNAIAAAPMKAAE